MVLNLAIIMVCAWFYLGRPSSGNICQGDGVSCFHCMKTPDRLTISNYNEDNHCENEQELKHLSVNYGAPEIV